MGRSLFLLVWAYRAGFFIFWAGMKPLRISLWLKLCLLIWKQPVWPGELAPYLFSLVWAFSTERLLKSFNFFWMTWPQNLRCWENCLTFFLSENLPRLFLIMAKDSICPCWRHVLLSTGWDVHCQIYPILIFCFQPVIYGSINMKAAGFIIWLWLIWELTGQKTSLLRKFPGGTFNI